MVESRIVRSKVRLGTIASQTEGVTRRTRRDISADACTEARRLADELQQLRDDCDRRVAAALHEVERLSRRVQHLEHVLQQPLHAEAARSALREPPPAKMSLFTFLGRQNA
jgi:hypothetical protein